MKTHSAVDYYSLVVTPFGGADKTEDSWASEGSLEMRYDSEFKTFAIECYEEVRSIRKAASDLRISRSTLQAWRKEAKRPKL